MSIATDLVNVLMYNQFIGPGMAHLLVREKPAKGYEIKISGFLLSNIRVNSRVNTRANTRVNTTVKTRAYSRANTRVNTRDNTRVQG